MNKNFSQKILEKIKEDNLTPKSSGYFITQRIILWLPGVLSVLVGALAVSSLIFGIAQSSWRYASWTHGSVLAAVLMTLPYMWVILAGIFGYLSIKAFRKTYDGYRYRVASLFLASILASIILGVIGYLGGIGKYLDNQLGQRNFPSAMIQQQMIWSDPLEGRIAGRVQKISEKTIRIKTFDEYLWNVNLSEISYRDKVILNTILDRHAQIRALGYIDPEFPNTFHACIVQPLLPPAQGDRIERLPIPRPDLSDLSLECRDILER
jgi:hypothetical protein